MQTPSEEKKEKDQKEHLQLEKPELFRLGVIGGVGFPRPLAVEGMVKIAKVVALGVEYSALPTMTLAGARVGMHSIAADVRVFPFRNAFFLGLRAGRQHVDADATITVGQYGTFEETAEFDATFVNPRLGFLWTFDHGITLGIEGGVQIPVSTSMSTSVPASIVALDPTVFDTASGINSSVIPTLDLLRVGFLF